MTIRKDEQTEFDRLYEQYGRPLEREHWGRYLAVSPDGDWVVGDSPLAVSKKASHTFGPGGYLYKIGAIDLGRIR